MHIYTHTHIHTYIHTLVICEGYIYVYIKCIHACIYTHIQTYIGLKTHTHFLYVLPIFLRIGMATSPVLLKKNYKSTSAVQVFYTGGPVAISSDASFIACACHDQVKVVDLQSGAVTSTLEGDSEPITAIALMPNGSSLFAASRSRQVKLWSLSSGTCIRSWKV